MGPVLFLRGLMFCPYAGFPPQDGVLERGWSRIIPSHYPQNAARGGWSREGRRRRLVPSESGEGVRRSGVIALSWLSLIPATSPGACPPVSLLSFRPEAPVPLPAPQGRGVGDERSELGF